MTGPSRWKRWLRVPRPVEQQASSDVDAELEFHLEMRMRELVAAGMSEAAARRRAEAEFGDVSGVRRSLREATASRERRARWLVTLDELRQDVRVGARALRSNPLFTIVAVITLALGVGANTAMFGLVNAVLLRPLPYEAPDRLVRVWESRPPDVPRNVVSRGNYLDWTEQATSFSGLAAYMQDFGYGLTGGAEPVQATGAQVTPTLFDVLGVDAAEGRTFDAAEGVTGMGGSVVLSWSFWQSRYGGDRSVLGQVVTIDGSPYEVVGVMPASFAFPSRQTDVWLPLTFGPADRNSREAHMLHVVGRLSDGATVESARTEMARLADSQRQLYPDAMEGWSATVHSLRRDITRGVRPALLVLLAAVGLVLLVACANVANLMLARSLSREREVAVRAALGAGRGRLVRQFLTESTLLAGLGGLAGLLVGALTLRLVVMLDPGEVPLIETATVDERVVGFAVLASILALFTFALLPAVRGARADLQSALRKASRGAGGGRQGGLRSALLVAEIAVSVVLIVGAGLLVRSFAALRGVDAGLDPENVLMMSLNLPVPAYSEKARQVAFYDEAVARLAAIPGAVGAAGTSEPPVVGYDMTRTVAIEGYTFSPGEREDVYYRAVTPEFFSTLRIPIVRGRPFAAGDRDGALPVVIVNQVMADRFWPGGEAVGGRVRMQEDGPWWEVVGIAGNVRQSGLEEIEEAAVYAPFAQKDWTWLTWMTLYVRTSGDPVALAAAARDAVWAVDPQLPIQSISTLEDTYGDSMARRRFTTTLLAAFAVMAVVLGAVGVYGVVGYMVTQRTREIGVRMALGAARGQVVGMVIGSGIRIAAVGAAAGLLLSLLATRALTGLLFGVGRVDVVTYAAALAFVAAVTIAASWFPARRASRVAPLRVLGSE